MASTPLRRSFSAAAGLHGAVNFSTPATAFSVGSLHRSLSSLGSSGGASTSSSVASLGASVQQQRRRVPGSALRLSTSQHHYGLHTPSSSGVASLSSDTSMVMLLETDTSFVEMADAAVDASFDLGRGAGGALRGLSFPRDEDDGGLAHGDLLNGSMSMDLVHEE